MAEAKQKVPERLLGRDFGPEGLGKIRAIIAEAGSANRSEVACRACEVMGWVTLAGMPRLMSASPERLPLGLWNTCIEARQDQEHGKASQRKKKPIEQKESYRWLEGYRHACDLARLAPQTQVILCADREADIYEIFVEHQNRLACDKPAASWLIRSKVDRCLEPFENEQTPEPATAKSSNGLNKVRCWAPSVSRFQLRSKARKSKVAVALAKK
jgi:hypothetical protein